MHFKVKRAAFFILTCDLQEKRYLLITKHSASATLVLISFMHIKGFGTVHTVLSCVNNSLLQAFQL